MYLVPIQVPIYLDGDRRLVTTEWRRALELLRDSLGGRFGEVVVVAPWVPVGVGGGGNAQNLEPVGEGVRLVAVFDKRSRRRHWVLSHRRAWGAKVRELARQAEVVHAGLDDLYRPLAWMGFRAGVEAGVPTVFVQDTDIALQQREMSEALPGGVKGRLARWRAEGYAGKYEAMCRAGVAEADLALLKGAHLMRRYGADARNAREFHDTSYLSSEIVGREAIEGRRGALRFVYAGRLIPRKGLEQGLRVVAEARRLGAEVEFDVIGDGPEAGNLKRLAGELGVGEAVRFHPPAAYGRGLLERLAGYDALLFTPTAEDTPRMIFDGYAAGLPLVGYDIEYVKERATEGATVLLPRGDVAGAARVVAGLTREVLARLGRRAHELAHHHAADVWYRRRAEWTFEAVERARRERKGRRTERKGVGA